MTCSVSRWLNIRVIVAVYLVLAGVYSLASPIFEAPDESTHFFVIKYIRETGRLPVQDPAASTLYWQEGSQPPLYYLAGALLISGIDVSAAGDYVRANPQANIGLPGLPNNKNHYIHTAREVFPYHDTVLAVHVLRGLSIGLGLITVVMTYALARQLFPDRETVALVAGMLVAFNPQFIYLSASINNDNALNALAACALYCLARLWRGDRSRRVILALSISAGLAALAKLGGLILLGFALGAIGYLTLKQRAWRWGVRAMLVVSGLAAVIAGWWYIRNVQLYGDPTGLNVMLTLLGGRHAPVTTAQLISELPGLWYSSWGVFGWFNMQLPEWTFGVYTVLMIGAIAGGGWALRRARRFSLRQLEPILALMIWSFLVFVGLVRWQTLIRAFQGRLLFSALPALAILLAVGLTRWLDRVRPWGVTGLAVILAAIAAWTPFGVIAPAYAQPPKITLTDIPANVKRVNIDFNGTVRLIGGYAEPRTIQANNFVTVKLYWQALRQPDRDYMVAVRLLGRDLERIGGDDAYPGAGTYPTDLWHAGDVLADQIVLGVKNGARAPTRVLVEVSVRDRDPQRTVKITDSDGSEVTDLIVIDELRLTGDEPQIAPEYAASYRLGDAIELIGYDAPRVDVEQQVIKYRLYWRVVRPPADDYTLFAHLLDKTGALIGSGDSQPFEADYPTSWWRAGEMLIEDRSLPVTTRGALENATLAIGLYRLADGTRLSVFDAAGQRLRDDQIMLSVK